MSLKFHEICKDLLCSITNKAKVFAENRFQKMEKCGIRKRFKNDFE